MKIAAVEKHMDAAYKIVRKELLKRVMTVMRGQPQVEEFCMAMGSWCFHLYNGEQVSDMHSTRKYASAVENIMLEYDDTFKLSGDPIRIRRVGKKFITILNW
jgi:hypothetical protein